MTRLLLYAALLFGSTAYAQHTVIVPLWAQGLPGAQGPWYTRLVISNPHAHPVIVQVVGMFPLDHCVSCSSHGSPTIVPAHSMRLLGAPHIVGESRAAALELRVSDRVVATLVAYGPGESGEVRQQLDVAHRWMEAGSHAIRLIERPSDAEWRMNAVITNPESVPVAVRIWVGPRDQNEVVALIPPHSTRIVSVPRPSCGPSACLSTLEYPPGHLRMDVESTGRVLVSVSTIGRTWAIFTLPESVRVDR